MEYQELNNYGKILTRKLPPRVLMAVFTSVPKELGFPPKFLAQIQARSASPISVTT